MSHAMFLRLLGGNSLWSVSRGLARNADKYKSRLAAADLPKRNSLDGRGALSLEELKAFCRFFLSVSIDQVDFMNKLLEPQEILRRMEIYVTEEVRAKRLPKGSFEMLREAFYRGSIQRGQAREITGYEETASARDVVHVARSGTTCDHGTAGTGEPWIPPRRRGTDGYPIFIRWTLRQARERKQVLRERLWRIRQIHLGRGTQGWLARYEYPRDSARSTQSVPNVSRAE